MDLRQLRILKEIPRRGQGTLSITKQRQFRGDQRAGDSVNQSSGFACYKDQFTPWQPENALEFGLFLGI